MSVSAAALCAFASLCNALVYVRARHDRHLGCVEKSLKPFEHLLLPRVLRCNEKHCLNDGSIELDVHQLDCSDADNCSAQVFCQARLSDVMAGLTVTFVGFAAVLAFACAPVAMRQSADIKLHKT